MPFQIPSKSCQGGRVDSWAKITSHFLHLTHEYTWQSPSCFTLNFQEITAEKDQHLNPINLCLLKGDWLPRGASSLFRCPDLWWFRPPRLDVGCRASPGGCLSQQAVEENRSWALHTPPHTTVGKRRE